MLSKELEGANSPVTEITQPLSLLNNFFQFRFTDPWQIVRVHCKRTKFLHFSRTRGHFPRSWVYRLLCSFSKKKTEHL